MSMYRLFLMIAVIATAGLLCGESQAQHISGFGGAEMADSSGPRASARTPSMSRGGISRARMRRRPPAGSLQLGGTPAMQNNPHFARMPTMSGMQPGNYETPESAADRAAAAIQERQRAATSGVRSFQIGRVGGGSARAD